MIRAKIECLQAMIKDAEWRAGSYVTGIEDLSNANFTYVYTQSAKIAKWQAELGELIIGEVPGE